MKALIVILSALISTYSSSALAKIRVGVIDTGIPFRYMSQVKLCDSGYIELSTESHDHGLNVVGLIQKEAKDADFCFVLVSAYKNNSIDITTAMSWLLFVRVDIINVSAGGLYDDYIERLIFMTALSRGITIVAAAGNNKHNLTKDCNYFPACYDKRIVVVGNSTSLESNYGKPVDLMIDGSNKTAFGVSMTGSSQSTAIHTGRLVRSMSANRKR